MRGLQYANPDHEDVEAIAPHNVVFIPFPPGVYFGQTQEKRK